MPGSPPIRIIEPFTIPPPRTLSSSSFPEIVRFSSPVSIEDKSIGLEPPLSMNERPLEVFALSGSLLIISSPIVLHAPQEGHFPIHFGLSAPQSLQNQAFLTFDIIVFNSVIFKAVRQKETKCPVQGVILLSRFLFISLKLSNF